MLRFGVSGTWAWSDSVASVRTGRINRSVGDGFVNLIYAVKDRVSNHRISVTQSPRTYGCVRSSFLCQVVAVVWRSSGGTYLHAGRFD